VIRDVTGFYWTIQYTLDIFTINTQVETRYKLPNITTSKIVEDFPNDINAPSVFEHNEDR
jgi:hypothetical protein